MAPVRTPARKRREADYSGIGQYGRKTGITVPDLGPRDEFGLEPVDNLFSSPDRNQARSEDRDEANGSEDMVLAGSIQDDTSKLLASARRRSHQPPKSRSPIKTYLGSSPRRSFGLVQPQPEAFLAHFLSQPPLRPNGLSPQSKRKNNDGQISKSSSLFKNSQLRKSDKPSALHLSPTVTDRGIRPAERTFRFSDEEDEEIEDVQGEVDFLQQPDLEYGSASSSEDDGVTMADLKELQVNGSTRERKGQKRKSDDREIAESQSRKRNRPWRKGAHEQTSEPSGHTHDDGTGEGFAAAPLFAPVADQVSSPGRPSTKAAQQTRKPSRAKASHSTSKAAAGNLKGKSMGKRANTGKAKKSEPAGNNNPEAAQEDTAQRDPPVTLRSGRTSVKPLAFWRGEQIIYQAPRRMGDNLVPGGYMGVDPGRKADMVKPLTSQRSSRRRPAKSKRADDSELDLSDPEDWEIEGDNPGVFTAGVFVWDPETQSRIEDTHEEIELALAPSALDERTEWAKGRSFKFVKTLSLPFFHSGVVDLPPGGEKQPKNSRKNHMIFWVFSGRVQVDVSGNIFNVGRGGMWQVPRGNTYGLSNPYDRDARIFFAQGSFMEQPEDETVFMGGASSGDQ